MIHPFLMYEFQLKVDMQTLSETSSESGKPVVTDNIPWCQLTPPFQCFPYVL